MLASGARSDCEHHLIKSFALAPICHCRFCQISICMRSFAYETSSAPLKHSAHPGSETLAHTQSIHVIVTQTGRPQTKSWELCPHTAANNTSARSLFRHRNTHPVMPTLPHAHATASATGGCLCSAFQLPPMYENSLYSIHVHCLSHALRTLRPHTRRQYPRPQTHVSPVAAASATGGWL